MPRWVPTAEFSPAGLRLLEELAAIHWEWWLLTGDGREPDLEVIAVINALAARGVTPTQLLSLGDGEKWDSVGGALNALGVPEVSNRHQGRQQVAMALVATRRFLTGADVRTLIGLLSQSAETREQNLRHMSDQVRDIVRRALEVLEHIVTELVAAGGLPTGRSERNKAVAELVRYIMSETSQPAALKSAFQTAGNLRELVEGALLEEALRRIEEVKQAAKAEKAKAAAVPTVVVETLEEVEPESVRLARQANALARLDEQLDRRERQIHEAFKQDGRGSVRAVELVAEAIKAAGAGEFAETEQTVQGQWDLLLTTTSKTIIPFFANDEPDTAGAWLQLIGDGWDEGAADAVIAQVSERVKDLIEEAEEELTRPDVPVTVEVAPAPSSEPAVEPVVEPEEIVEEEGEPENGEPFSEEVPPAAPALTGPFAEVEWPQDLLDQIARHNPAGTDPRLLLIEAVEAGIEAALKEGKENKLNNVLQRAFRQIQGVGGKTVDRLVPLVYASAKEIFREQLTERPTNTEITEDEEVDDTPEDDEVGDPLAGLDPKQRARIERKKQKAAGRRNK